MHSEERNLTFLKIPRNRSRRPAKFQLKVFEEGKIGKWVKTIKVYITGGNRSR